MVVVSGSNSGAMAEQLADALGWSHHALETRRFPDTEGYVRIPSTLIETVRSEPVVLVSNTFPDSGIVETLLMLEAINDVRRGDLQNLREIGPQTLPDVGKGVFLAVPYFGYSRQDKRFKPGESISAKSIANLMAGQCDGIIVLDIHAPEVLSDLKVPIALHQPCQNSLSTSKQRSTPTLFCHRTKEPLLEPRRSPTKLTVNFPISRKPESMLTPLFTKPRTWTLQEKG